ncbi:MAG: phage adaptor protein [Armatimonadota bacterium]
MLVCDRPPLSSQRFAAASSTMYYTGLTFSQLKSQVYSALAEFANPTAGYRALGDELVSSWVRQGHAALDAALSFTREVVTLQTVAGQRAYDLPAQVQEILLLTVDGAPCKRLNVLEDQVLQAASQERGKVQTWAWWGQQIHLYPAPQSGGQTVGLWAVVLPQMLDAEDDVPAVPAPLHQAIVHYALMEGYRHIGDPQRAVLYQQMFDAVVAQASAKHYVERGGDLYVRRDVP